MRYFLDLCFWVCCYIDTAMIAMLHLHFPAVVVPGDQDPLPPPASVLEAFAPKHCGTLLAAEHFRPPAVGRCAPIFHLVVVLVNERICHSFF
jgi:hypothetical protein